MNTQAEMRGINYSKQSIQNFISFLTCSSLVWKFWSLSKEQLQKIFLKSSLKKNIWHQCFPTSRSRTAANSSPYSDLNSIGRLWNSYVLLNSTPGCDVNSLGRNLTLSPSCDVNSIAQICNLAPGCDVNTTGKILNLAPGCDMNSAGRIHS